MSDRAPARPGRLDLAAPFFVVLAGHLSLFPRVADLDGFYHLGHAAAYLERSVLDPSLPWATRSIIADYGGDLWWGFHMFLLPFAALGSVEAGMRLAALALTAGLACTLLWVLRRHGVPWPGLWTALFLIAVPNVFFRHLMVRPHVISLAASFALLSVLVRGRWWQVALVSALTAWVHLSLFWAPPLLAGIYSVARVPVTVFLGREGPDTGVPVRLAIPAAALGAALGWILRPEPLATAALLNVQLLQLFAQKATGAPLTFAAELSPIGLPELGRTAWLFSVAWLAALPLLVRAAVRGDLARLGQARGTLLVAAAAASILFLALAVGSARRAMEQWVAFGFLALPLLAMALHPAGGIRRLDIIKGAAVVLLAGHLAWGAWRHSLNVRLVAYPANSLRQAAEFLAAESRPGDVVFHARWDNFGPLFAFNRTNRYLGGMDPIFQFAHDPAAFWEFFYLSVDATSEWTCDAYPCTQGVATDTHEALTQHFGARWVLVEPRRNPRLTLFFLNDPRFALALETQREAVFEILDPSLGEGAP